MKREREEGRKRGRKGRVGGHRDGGKIINYRYFMMSSESSNATSTDFVDIWDQ